MPPARLPCCLSISFSLVFGVNTLAGFSLSCVICRKNGSLILASGCTRELFCKVRSCFFSDSYVPALGLLSNRTRFLNNQQCTVGARLLDGAPAHFGRPTRHLWFFSLRKISAKCEFRAPI